MITQRVLRAQRKHNSRPNGKMYVHIIHEHMMGSQSNVQPAGNLQNMKAVHQNMTLVYNAQVT